MSALPYCCVCAQLDGIPEADHQRVCREPQKAAQAPAIEAEPEADALSDLDPQPTRGGRR